MATKSFQVTLSKEVIDILNKIMEQTETKNRTDVLSKIIPEYPVVLKRVKELENENYKLKEQLKER